MRTLYENLDQIEDIVIDLVVNKQQYFNWDEFDDITDFYKLLTQLREAEKNTQEYIETLEQEIETLEQEIEYLEQEIESLNEYIEMEQEQVEYMDMLDSMHEGEGV